MNVLAVDIGNTRVKWSVWSEKDPLLHVMTDALSMADLLPVIERYKVQEVALSSTNFFDKDLFEALRSQFDGRIHVIDNDYSSYNIIPSYRHSLGTDRFAAYLGALSLLPSKACLIADAGSALTTDVVDSEGQFKGGNISPGVSMRLRALNEFTAALPLVSPHGKLRSFGDNTETAIRSGVINGIVAEITDAFFRAQESCGVFDLILTGGDSELLFPLMENKGIENVHLDLLLVERGLNMYALGGGKLSQVLECPAFFKN